MISPSFLDSLSSFLPDKVTTICHLQGADGLLAGLEILNEEVLSQTPNLKAISRIGIGMDNIDQKAAKKHKIKVSNTPDAPTTAVAEMALAALLLVQTFLVDMDHI